MQCVQDNQAFLYCKTVFVFLVDLVDGFKGLVDIVAMPIKLLPVHSF